MDPPLCKNEIITFILSWNKSCFYLFLMSRSPDTHSATAGEKSPQEGVSAGQRESGVSFPLDPFLVLLENCALFE